VYEVESRHSSREIRDRLNREKRVDEKPLRPSKRFPINQRAYELFARPFVQALSNDFTADLGASSIRPAAAMALST
jgi:hypothetical protein